MVSVARDVCGLKPGAWRHVPVSPCVQVQPEPVQNPLLSGRGTVPYCKHSANLEECENPHMLVIMRRPYVAGTLWHQTPVMSVDVSMQLVS